MTFLPLCLLVIFEMCLHLSFTTIYPFDISLGVLSTPFFKRCSFQNQKLLIQTPQTECNLQSYESIFLSSLSVSARRVIPAHVQPQALWWIFDFSQALFLTTFSPPVIPVDLSCFPLSVGPITLYRSASVFPPMLWDAKCLLLRGLSLTFIFPGVGNKMPRHRSMFLLNWKVLLYLIVLSLSWTKYSALAQSQFVDWSWTAFQPPASHKRQCIVHVKRVNSGVVLHKHILGLCHSLAEGLRIGYLTSLNFSFLTRMWTTIECIHYHSLFYFLSI